MDENAIKVDLHAAAEFAAKGFTVECYVLPDKPAAKEAKATRGGHTRRPNIPSDARIALSFDGHPPKNGTIRRIFDSLKDEYFKDDISRTLTADEIRNYYIEHGGYHSDLAKLVYHYNCLRIVS